ncbi:Protein T2 [Cichlidogyrus casuarinus]|uniref:Protein T2 n=1 Tax=Cichlidogyrus casuarinus TaxID=1844966 RepID=A0ABD2QLP2_9PLAT
MRSSWISEAWARRSEFPSICALHSDFLERHRAQVFQQCFIAFVGFPLTSDVLNELHSLTIEHDGTVIEDLNDTRLTHVIVSDQLPSSIAYQAEISQSLSCLITQASPAVVEPAEEDSLNGSSNPMDSLNSRLSILSIGRPSGCNQALIACGSYKVPVLRLEWFWRSLQQTCLCTAEHFIYVPPSPEVALDRLSEHELELQNESGLSTCARPTPEKSFLSERSNSTVLSPRISNLSTEDLVARLADPMSFPSNRVRRDRIHQMQAFSLEVSPVSGAGSNKMKAANKSLDTLSEEESRSPSSFLSTGPQSVSSPIRKKSRRLSQILGLKASVSSGEYCSTQTELPGIAETLVGSSAEPQTEETSYTDAHSKLSSFTSPSRQDSHTSLFKRAGSGLLNQSAEKVALQTKLERRQHRIFEFFLTEANYFDILSYLTQNAYQQVLDDSQIGGSILPQKEADFIFGKLVPIYELHSKLKTVLDDLEASWITEESCLGPVLAPFLGEMESVYAQCMEFYSPAHLKQLGYQYPRFLAFMRQVEKRKESGKQSLNDLLIRPVQRLPSINLLLGGIVKATPSCHPDYTSICDVACKLTEVLAKINERLKKNEERISLYCLFNDIQGAPVSVPLRFQIF